jgi:hypothetical protein
MILYVMIQAVIRGYDVAAPCGYSCIWTSPHNYLMTVEKEVPLDKIPADT